MRWLVERGADVNAKGDNGWSVLHAAATVGNLTHVKWLVEHGANPAARNFFGETVLEGAKSRRQWDVIKWLKDECGQIEDNWWNRRNVVELETRGADKDDQTIIQSLL
jgi:ankyrin repeat protein